MYKAYDEANSIARVLVNDSAKFCNETPSDRNFLDLHVSAAMNRSNDLRRFYEVMTKLYTENCYNYALKNTQSCKQEPYNAIQKMFTAKPRLFEYFEHGRGNLKEILNFLRKTKMNFEICW